MTCQDAPDLQITEAFTAKAAELMARYGIDRALLAAARPETDKPGDRVIDIANPWARVQAHLLCGLASAMRCQCVVLPRSESGSRIHVFGFLCTLSSRATVEPYLGRHWRHSDCRHGRWRRGPTCGAQVSAVISSPDLGVFAVAAAGALCAFCCVADTLPEQCLRRGSVPIPLSLLVLELSGYYVNAVQLHVHAADVLVRCGIHREGFR
jgi:hypothetical protein